VLYYHVPVKKWCIMSRTAADLSLGAQVIVSAKANAENNHGMDASKLAIGRHRSFV